jgi:hypothetical protein
MVDGGEESQLRGPIDVLAPYSSKSPSDGTRNRCRNTSHIVVFLVTSGPYGTAFKPAVDFDQPPTPRATSTTAPIPGTRT